MLAKIKNMEICMAKEVLGMVFFPVKDYFCSIYLTANEGWQGSMLGMEQKCGTAFSEVNMHAIINSYSSRKRRI